MKEKAYEINFDGLVGPTHNYSGLSYGNLASMGSEQSLSNPQAAALQGLAKMKFLHDKGIKQALLPPHERPHIPFLKNLKWQGRDSDILKQAAASDRELFYACCSASSMWAANAATVSPSCDSLDQHVHITPANLASTFHRSLEADFTARIFKSIFREPVFFTHHPPLPGGIYLADEGAANHVQFSTSYGQTGLQLFVYGRYGLKENFISSEKFPARQTYEACQAIAQRHCLYPNHAIFAQQSPKAIEAGVFHNDVISVGNLHVFLYHEEAFTETELLIEEIRIKAEELCDMQMVFIPISPQMLTLEEAVQSYFFNSQLISLPEGGMMLVAPSECQDGGKVEQLINFHILQGENPIQEVHYLNLKESMRNGGGPACLRLRMTLNERELSAVSQTIFMSDSLYFKLEEWIKKHYRDRLLPSDLADPKLLREIHNALDELTRILNFGSIYSFQR